MEERLKSAYHEAGHCFRAWDYCSMAIRSVCLHESEVAAGGWEGSLDYKKSWFPTKGLRLVAFAGVLAEAKAVASEGLDLPRDVASSPDLVSAICEIIKTDLPNDAGPPGWNISVPIAGYGDQEANISREDILQIPLTDRTKERIADALDHTTAFVNGQVHWKIIADLAFELDRLAPKCFGAFRIFMIVDESISGMRAQQDSGGE